MTLLIGISGPIGSGKSTLARGLVDLLELTSMRGAVIPFASGLKEIATWYKDTDRAAKAMEYFRSLGYSKDKAYNAMRVLEYAFTEYPVVAGSKPRRLLQAIGTEVGRDTLGTDVWIKDVHKRIHDLRNKPHLVFHDDMRFLNEREAVDIHVAIVLTTPLDTAVYEARKSLLPPEYFYSNHASEKELAAVVPDYIINLAYSPSQLITLFHSLLKHRKLYV
jgi:energy-coupling factor transporter ATP-binding protein EcfA2